MQKYADSVINSSGRPVQGATVTVRTLVGDLATIYSDNGSTVIPYSVVTTDSSGEYSFYAANGRYNLTIEAAGFDGETKTDELLFDPADERVSAYDFGAVGDGTDETTRLQAFFAELSTGKRGVIPSGHWVCNAPVTMADGVAFDLEIAAGAVLDFSGADVAAGSGAIEIGTDAGGLTALPTLAASVAQGDRSFTLASAPALDVGDVYVLWDDDDFSWLNVASREYYKAGELHRVMSVAGAVVENEVEAWDAYATGADKLAAKLTTNTVSITGAGEVRFPNATTSSGILLWNGYRCNIGGFSVKGATRAQVDLRRCYETEVSRLRSADLGASVDLNYGVSMISCYDTHVRNSHIFTTRHAVALTGGDIEASIPNRRCSVTDSTVGGDLFALDMHGACEHCRFEDNDVYGGVWVAGDHSVVRGGKIFTNRNAADYLGVGVRLREPKGANHAVESLTIHCLDAASGSDSALMLEASNAERGGTLRVHGVRFTSDAALTLAGRVGIGAGTDKVSVSVDGVSYDRQTGDSPNFRIQGVAGGAFKTVALTNLHGVAPRLNNVAAKQIAIDGVIVDGSTNDGLQMAMVAYAGAQQLVDVRNVVTRANKNGGIVLTGPGKTEDVVVTLNNCSSFNNGQDGATASTSKASVTIANTKRLSLVNNKVGDTQAVATQTYSVSLTNIESVRDVHNEQLVSALAKNTSSVDAITTSIAAL